MAIRNPFAAREVKTDPQRADMQMYEAPEYVVPQHGAYGVPSLEQGSPYIKEFGYAATLRTSTTEIPSAQRLQQTPLRDYRPRANRPPEEFWGPKDADDKKRHSVESVDADGWEERKGYKRFAPNPRSTPPPEPRMTSLMAPRSYSFTRPFDQHSARKLNGQHFSMADHRRNYEILGMSPVRTMRNTYRIEPTPWDTDVVDLPPDNTYQPDARLMGTDLPMPTRSWRL